MVCQKLEADSPHTISFLIRTYVPTVTLQLMKVLLFSDYKKDLFGIFEVRSRYKIFFFLSIHRIHNLGICMYFERQINFQELIEFAKIGI